MPGWHSRFPAPAPDDTEPGTVFETSAHGQHSQVEVTYQLTALAGPGGRRLAEFAGRYPAYLRHGKTPSTASTTPDSPVQAAVAFDCGFDVTQVPCIVAFKDAYDVTLRV